MHAFALVVEVAAGAAEAAGRLEDRLRAAARPVGDEVVREVVEVGAAAVVVAPAGEGARDLDDVVLRVVVLRRRSRSPSRRA
jgi:hypothetical protein